MNATEQRPPSGYSFLVADDEEEVRELVGHVLAAQGHRVLSAEDGLSALELYRKHRPDVVISDVRMPGLDGVGLLGEVRALEPSAEVMLITGHGDKNLAIEALRRGASNFLEKPFTPSSLVGQVEPSLTRVGLRRENEALREALEEERSLRERRSRLEVMGRLLGGLSRELLIPLDFATSAVDLLRRRVARALEGDREGLLEAPALIEELQFCTRRMQGLISDVARFLAPPRRPPVFGGLFEGSPGTSAGGGRAGEAGPCDAEGEPSALGRPTRLRPRGPRGVPDPRHRERLRGAPARGNPSVHLLPGRPVRDRDDRRARGHRGGGRRPRGSRRGSWTRSMSRSSRPAGTASTSASPSPARPPAETGGSWSSKPRRGPEPG